MSACCMAIRALVMRQRWLIQCKEKQIIIEIKSQGLHLHIAYDRVMLQLCKCYKEFTQQILIIKHTNFVNYIASQEIRSIWNELLLYNVCCLIHHHMQKLNKRASLNFFLLSMNVFLVVAIIISYQDTIMFQQQRKMCCTQEISVLLQALLTCHFQSLYFYTSGLICTLFMYFVLSIHTILHTKLKENQLSTQYNL